ncbi:MAG: hypothetical protein FJ117_12345 [Deltaproteobacteria bacterium]|nr:hypothetical protein [Chloroflexota bacterium]MBM4331986.1 hypothetical protein [Deltaproteobacteria bacterium]
MARKKLEPQPYAKPDQIQIRGNQIFSPLRQKWVPLTPEEMVRQQYQKVLVEEYGFTHEHMAEEMEVTGKGSAQARADFIIWRIPQDKAAQKSPLIVVECKADNVAIDRAVYAQGENYARLTNAPFFVTHNHRETRYWRVLHDKMPKHVEEIEGIPHADASDKEIRELIDRLKVFKEDEFADLLHQCHNVIRNREKRDPVAAFDEIAKILFIKVYVERELKAKRKRQNLFSVAFLMVKVEPTFEYKMAGVKWYGEGVFHRERVRGDALSARWISPLVPGALIYNRLFAWKASFAVVSADLADCHVSNEFPQFVTDPTKLLPKYLYLWCTTDQTIKAVNTASTESAAVSRNRFREEFFFDFKVPLPPLPVQQKIVAAWEAAKKAAGETAAKIGQIERDIEACFLADLGLKTPPSGTTLPKCLIVWWQYTSRWDLPYFRRAAFNPNSTKYPNARLLEVIHPLRETTQRVDPHNLPNEEFNYLGMESVEACTGAILGFTPRKGNTIKSSCVYFDKGHVLYGKLRPYLRKVVDCSELPFDTGIASSEFLPLRTKDGVLQSWLAFLLRSSAIAEQAKVAIGARMPRIAPHALLDFVIPLPPLHEQARIMVHVSEGRAGIAKLKAEAKARAEAAKADVEAMILGIKKVETP